VPTAHVGTQPVHFIRGGRGRPALVLIHGSGGDHTLWGWQLKGLKGQFEVVPLDLNGHGRSLARARDGLESYTEDALAVLDAIDGPAVLAGHSLGGAVALNAALTKPDNLVGLGLIDTGAKLRVLPKLLELIRDDFDGALDFLLGLLFHRPLPDTVGEARAQMARNGQAALLRDFETCDAFDVMDRLAEIAVPALVCVGSEDQMTPLKYAQFLAERIPDAELVTIPDAGHVPMLEQPDVLNDALRAFLSRLRSD